MVNALLTPDLTSLTLCGFSAPEEKATNRPARGTI